MVDDPKASADPDSSSFDAQPSASGAQANPNTTRIALGVEYRGTRYHGWQIQANTEQTVQAQLTRVLSSIAVEPVRLFCAGRTDAGVHARGQVVHFDTQAQRPLSAWVRGANSRLPDDIRVRWAQPVSQDFHARFSAVSRRYCYVIDNRKVRSALFSELLTWHYQPLDTQTMLAAAEYLVGEHDFTSYRTVHCQARSPVKTVHYINIKRQQELVVIDIKANAFLHHMVRNIAGVLMAVGSGEAPPQWAQQVLEARDRCLGGVTAPSQGLYLMQVGYPDEFQLPEDETGLSLFSI